MTSLIRYIQNINRQTAWSFCPIRRLAARTAISGLALSLSLFGIAKPATAATTTLSFNSTPVLVSGTDRTQGAVYRFANVFAGVDALVQVETIQNAQLKVIDDNSSFPARFQPVIAPASLGRGLTVTEVALLPPFPQVFIGVTVTSPEDKPKLTVMLVEPCPLVTVAPVGTDQEYEVAPLTAAIL